MIHTQAWVLVASWAMFAIMVRCGSAWIETSIGQWDLVYSGLGCIFNGNAAMVTGLDYGFMPRSVAFKGFVEGQGYTHAEPGTLRWARHDTETEL